MRCLGGFGLSIVTIVYGMEAVSTMGGKYLEMWYFTWEDGGIVFKPNYMPKKYAIAILPISGFLVSIAAIIQDTAKIRAGTYHLIRDTDTQNTTDVASSTALILVFDN